MPAMQTLWNLPFLLGSRELREKSFPWCRKPHFMVHGVFMAPCTETINMFMGGRGRGGLWGPGLAAWSSAVFHLHCFSQAIFITWAAVFTYYFYPALLITPDYEGIETCSTYVNDSVLRSVNWRMVSAARAWEQSLCRGPASVWHGRIRARHCQVL